MRISYWSSDVCSSDLLKLVGQLLKQLHNLSRCDRVERSRGLVGQQNLRLLHKRAYDADTLALAPGQFVCTLVGIVRNTYELPQMQCTFYVFGRIAPGSGTPLRDVAQATTLHVFNDGAAADQVYAFKDQADTASP